MSIENRNSIDFNNSFRRHSQIINNRRRKPYGTTALENARRSLEILKEKKEDLLFTRLQHKIKTEYLKYKTFSKYNKKQNHFNNIQDKLHIKKQNDLYNRQLEYNERFQNHYELERIQKHLKKEKINRYNYIYQQKEKKIIQNNLNKQNKLKDKYDEEEIKNQEAQYRLNCLNKNDEKRRNDLFNTIKKNCEKRVYKKAQKECENRYNIEQKNYEKAQQINAAIYLLERKQKLYHKNYEKKQKQDIEKMNKLNKRKEEESQERKLNNYYRYASHDYLIKTINKKDNQRNKDYFNKQKIIEKNKILKKIENDKKSAERRELMEEKNDTIKFNLKNCEINENKFRDRVRYKILDREKKTEKILHDKQVEHNRKKEENEEKEREMEYIKNRMELDDSFKRNKKREELDKKKEDIDNFENKRERINDKKREINDNYNNQYNYYSQKIDNLMYNRHMDNTALNNVREMFYDNRNLAGIVQNVTK